MKIRAPNPVMSAALLVAAGAAVGVVASRRGPSAKPGFHCDGEYSDSLQAAGRAQEMKQFTFLVRSTARYECPYFGPDRKLLRRRIEAKEHGTAFAYEVSGDETYLLTNEHLAVWPEVTDTSNKVDGVQDGCRRVEENLRIVQDEHDDYEPGHLALKLVAFDPQLDAAILKAPRALTALPYRIGKSAALRQGNAVQVRGFPLGLMHAVNTGKVVNPYDRDQEQGWEHTDFVIDAILSEGNSGSPVLALSCRTGQLQLVGMYHAGYKGHAALNVAVGIDQLRDLMLKKRRVPRAPTESTAGLGASGRKRLREALETGSLPLFEFGGLHVWAEPSGDSLLYHFFSRDFPLDERRIAIMEDRPAGQVFGEISRLWVSSDNAWREWRPGDLGVEERDLLVRLADGVRTHIIRVLGYRRALAAEGSADERRRGREVLRNIQRHALAAREMAATLVDLVERLAPPTREGAPVAAGTADGGAPTPNTPSFRLDHPTL